MAAIPCHGEIWMVVWAGLGGGLRNVPNVDQEVLKHPTVAQFDYPSSYTASCHSLEILAVLSYT